MGSHQDRLQKKIYNERNVPDQKELGRLAETAKKSMTLEPHSIAWYARLAGQQKGYFYPWHSQLAPHNGEDSFWPLVFEHLHPELDVLEIACAQGDLALAMAPGCRSVLAYDVTQEGTQCHSSLLGRQVHGDRDEYG